MKQSEIKRIIREEIYNIIKEEVKKGYDQRLAKFIQMLQTRENGYKKKNFPNLKSNKFGVAKGKRFDKITSTTEAGEGATSVYAFVEKETGHIFKPASWRAPAKHARGNIFNSDILKGTGVWGVDYLR